MWLKNWREVIAFCSSISNSMLFESSGSAQQQEQQYSELLKNYERVSLLKEVSDDDPGQRNRRLYYCTLPHA
jgi:hypothetical protein